MGCLGTWQSRQILTCRAFGYAHTHTHTQTRKIHKTLPHEASKFNPPPPSKWMSSHCNISHPCFFAQLNLLIHFASKPICLSSRSQTVPCPHCSLFSCTVYFSLSCALLSLNDEAISRASAPWEIEGISVHTSVPPPPPSSFPAASSSHLPHSLPSSLL